MKRKAVRTATKTPRDTTPSAATISSTKKRKAVRTATKAVRSDTKTPRSTTGEKLPSGARSKRPNVLSRLPLLMFHAGKVYETISKDPNQKEMSLYNADGKKLRNLRCLQKYTVADEPLFGLPLEHVKLSVEKGMKAIL